ncbi:sister chromatid cohesion protein 1 [Monosporozyma servazzii]
MTTEPTNIILNIATNSGPLAQIWLASNMSNVSRNSALQTSIPESVHEIAKVAGCDIDVNTNDAVEEDREINTGDYITLRTSGELLHGVVRVYSKQAGFLLSDIKDTLIKISSLFKTSSKINITLGKGNTISKLDQLILEDTVTEREVLALPDLDFLNDDVTSDRGLLSHFNPMERQVQGATTTNNNPAFDMSIEVGRNVNNPSGLDLDFDINEENGLIDNSHNKSSWIEGTQNTEITMDNSEINFNDANNEDGNNAGDDWNLDFNSNEDNGVDNDLSQGSIELGRRAESVDINEPTDFGFDLEIEKEQPDIQLETENITKNHQERQELNKKSKTRNPAFKHTVPVESDSVQELSNEQLDDESSTIVSNEASVNKQASAKLNQKRLWEQMTQTLGFLPDAVVANYLDYRRLKKPRADTVENVEIDEPEFDASLELDSNPLDMDNNGDNLDVDMLDHMEIGNNDDDMEGFPDVRDINELLSSPSKSDTSSRDNREEDNHIRLVTGEIVTNSAMQLANILKEKNNSVNTFDDLITKKRDRPETSSNTISKQEASACFFDMLSLATAGCIDLSQEEAFDQINLTTNNSLFEKFITA